MGLAWPTDAAAAVPAHGRRRADPHDRQPGLPFAVVNNYGLSETTVVATSGVVARPATARPRSAAPITGVVAEVVDERPAAGRRRARPASWSIGGVAVGRGYLNRPELTAERFLDGPARAAVPHRRPGAPVRPTARSSSSGASTSSSASGASASSRPRSSPRSTRIRLSQASIIVGVGSVRRSPPARRLRRRRGRRRAPRRDELNEFLGRVPARAHAARRYSWLDELPLTHHGKIDRDALPAAVGSPSRPLARVRREAADAPAESREAISGPIIAELLSRRLEIRPGENFFLLGGHSMLGAQLIVRLEDLFGVEITLRYLFDHPTLGRDRRRGRAPDGRRARPGTSSTG